VANPVVNTAQNNFTLNFRASLSFVEKFATGILNAFSLLILPANRQKGSHVSQLIISAAIRIKPSAFAGALEAKSATFSNLSLCRSFFIKVFGSISHSFTFLLLANSDFPENDLINNNIGNHTVRGCKPESSTTTA
jgi:hypothetical protein